MPAAKKQRQSQGGSAKTRLQNISLVIGMTLIIVVVGSGWILSHANLLERGIWLDTSYEVAGSPTISADFINQVLDSYGSPASGKGQVLYDLGVRYHIDPVYALAFFLQESRFGTTGVARVTLSLGNIRVTPGYDSYDGYRKYKSWEAGFEDWYKLIHKQYVQTWKLSTIDQIVPVYAPSADHNDVDAYIQSVKSAVDSWRLGEVQV
ncbi:MAG TPA: glucosaminidase domain-containing protein [Ktedonobacteraceae bacterium]|nr:glucosaminidase domain-containing protein [Ktedonobacteraceae bacterium]